MLITEVEIGQELVYQTEWLGEGPGPRIRVTERRLGYIVGVVLDPMTQQWSEGSEFLGMAEHFDPAPKTETER